MFVDTSVIIAIIKLEPEKDAFLDRLEAARHRYTSPLVVLEAVMRLSSLMKEDIPSVRQFVGEVLSQANVEIIPINQKMGEIAIQAFDQYGKGRHPARLNMADCFSYAGAKAYRSPLLYKGNDFSQTDLA
jgi:ribonuclease VapC